MILTGKPIVLGAFVAATICARSAAPASATDSIGIYFDTAATQTCLTDSLYTPVLIYLVLKDPSDRTGVAGWEGRFSADEGIFLTPVSTNGGGLNTATFPEYSIGLTAPLPYRPMTVLATLTAFATRPGGLYFRANSRPSMPAAPSGVYAAGDSPGTLVAMQCQTGDCELPLATIADGGCGDQDTPQPQAQDLRQLPIPDAQDVSYANIAGRIVEDQALLPRSLPMMGLAGMLYKSGFSCIGVIEDVAYRCLERTPAQPANCALARVRVERSFWGTNSDIITVLLPCAHADNCTETRDSPFASKYSLGDTYLLIGSWHNDLFEAFPLGVLQLRGTMVYLKDEPLFAVADVMTLVSGTYRIRDMASQFTRTPIIVLANVESVVRNGDGSSLVRVVQRRAYKGVLPNDYCRIPPGLGELSRDGQYSLAPTLRRGETYVLFLGIGDGGEPTVENGAWGAYRVDGGMLISGVNTREGSLAALENLAREHE